MSSLVIPAAPVFETSCRQTDTWTNSGANRTPATADGVGNQQPCSQKVDGSSFITTHIIDISITEMTATETEQMQLDEEQLNGHLTQDMRGEHRMFSVLFPYVHNYVISLNLDSRQML